MGRSWTWFAGALLGLSCGGSPAKPEPKATVAVALPPPEAEGETPESKRSASEIIRRYWLFGDTAEIALYADLQGLVRTELFSALMKSVLAQPELSTTPAQRDCIQDALSAVRELAIGGAGGQPLFIVRFEANALRTSPASCLSNVVELMQRTAYTGTEVYEEGDAALAIKPGLVLYGAKKRVTQALQPDLIPQPWPSGLDLSTDRYLAFNLKTVVDVSGSGSLLVAPDRFRFDARLQLKDEAMAIEGEQKIRDLLTSAESFSPLVNLRELLKGLTVERNGRWLIGALEFNGNVAEQLGVIAALSAHSVRKYVLNSKQAEARNIVGQIAKDYSSSWSAALKKTPKQKSWSLPAVPKSVPRGQKYQSKPGDWQAWKRIGFSFQDPQYYQYEVIASQDGSTAEVVARGDLDGDGVPSKFVLALRAERGEIYAAPSIDETDPDE